MEHVCVCSRACACSFLNNLTYLE
uniref:Uncharacterized protein n=1 Tax=Anguilla anguilla TaxID=7936 RepID=A0A0E9U3A8_ANGAN